MKPTSVALLCLPFFLVLIHLTLARRGTSGGKTTSHGTSTSTANRGNTNSGKKPTKVTHSQTSSNNPKKADSNQRRPTANQYEYPQHGWGTGQANQLPAGGHLNYNPSNRILSPGYGGSYGYGGHGAAGGSPYSRRVQGMGYKPSSSSRGFGRGAETAAGAGIITGMTLGYGLGRIPRPKSHFHFQSPDEERYYYHYMYQRYGSRSTDGDDYSRDYVFSPPSFSEHMNTCMKRQDLLPAVKTPTSPIIPMATDNGRGKKTLESNDTLGYNNTVSSDKPTANPLPPASKGLGMNDADDDTVSVVDIGYPALIYQLKVRSCVEVYIDNANGYLRRQGSVLDGVAQGAGRGLQQVLAVVVGTLLSLGSYN